MPIPIYSENRVTFKIISGYYFKHLILETMRLLQNTKNTLTTEKMVKMGLI